MKITFQVLGTGNLTQEEIYTLLLESEVKMNTQSKLRFHLINVEDDTEEVDVNDIKVF